MRYCTKSDLAVLLGPHDPPCVSIFMPTHRAFPACQQDPIHFRNLLNGVEQTLRQKYPGHATQDLQEKLRGLLEDHAFWTHRLDGLAVLGSPNDFQVFDLERAVPERAIVTDSYHVKPLLRIVQSADRYHVLCLQRDEAKIYEGNRDALTRLEIPGLPTNAEEALGDAVFVLRREQVPGGKSAGERFPAPRGPNVPPGHPATRDDAKLDAERFFRAIDRAVWEKVSRPADLPLVLVALPEHQAVFRSESHNPRLLETGVERSPAGMSEKDLRQSAWKCVEPNYLSSLQKICDDFEVARARGLASMDLADAAPAAHDARVGILLIEADRVIPGRIHPGTGQVVQTGATQEDDVLDDLAEMVLRRKGTVVVVPKERMPSSTGLAAIYRF